MKRSPAAPLGTAETVTRIAAMVLSAALMLGMAGCGFAPDAGTGARAESPAIRETGSGAEALRPNENPYDASETGGWTLTEEEISAAKQNAGNGLSSRPEENICYLSIGCGTAIDGGLNKTKGFTHLPGDGMILPKTEVTFQDGDTVFAVLAAAVRAEGIHMEYSGGAGLEYVKGIDNLYEFDAGRFSGWMFCVNGWFPNYGCGQYKIERGDVIEWNYTCDLGEDLGAKVEGGGRRDE